MNRLISVALVALALVSGSGITWAAVANPLSLGLASKASGGFKGTPKTPIVVVLIHGATPPPSQPGGVFYPEPSSASLDYTRFYFSFPFVHNLLGAPAAGLKTLGGVDVTGQKWDAHGAANSTTHKVSYSFGVSEPVVNDHFLVPGDYVGTETPPISVLLTHRDGSRALMSQVKDVINQIYDEYTQTFGTLVEPKPGRKLPVLILLTHSFGGPVARAILSAPSEPIDNTTLSAVELQRAQAIRDATLAVVMLASPNEGSPLADRAIEIKGWLNGDGKAALGAFSLLLPDAWKACVEDARASLVAQLGRPANADLTRSFWSQMNTGPLAPERGVRSDATAVPVYTMIGHSQAGKFYTNPDTQWPLGGVDASDVNSETGRREVSRAVGLMFLDYALHNVPAALGNSFKTWGGVLRRTPELDIVARYHRNNLGVTLSAPGEDLGVPLGIPKFYNRNNVTVSDPIGSHTRQSFDTEADADGLVDVESGHGMRLGTGFLPNPNNYYFDHRNTHTIDGVSVRGSWYRIEVSAAYQSQPSTTKAWTYANHEEIHRLPGTAEWIFQNIVKLAGPIVGSDERSVWPEPLPNLLLR